MNIQISNTPLNMEIYGYSAIALNKEYVQTAFRLSGKTWDTIKNNTIQNKGKNCWVYESDERVFAGVELINNADGGKYKMESMRIQLEKYAYYKHVGPYSLIKEAGQNMIHELLKMGYKTREPYIEIYGHWTNNEALLETELIMNIR